MQHNNSVGIFSAKDETHKLRSELDDLQRRLSFLANTTNSHLEQMHLAAQTAMKTLKSEGTQLVWTTERRKGEKGNEAWCELLEIIGRAQRDVQLASTSPLWSNNLISSRERERESLPLPTSFNSNNNNDNNNNTGSMGREDDISKAHHLARLLQERNDIKEKFIKSEENSAALQRKLTSLRDEHNRLIYSITSNKGVNTISEGLNSNNNNDNISLEAMKEAMRQLYDRRVQELEEELMSTKEELINVKTGSTDRYISSNSYLKKSYVSNGIIDSGNASIASGQNEESIEGLRRQNTFLRNRIIQLKEELRTNQQSSIGSAEHLNNGLDDLLNKITELQQELVMKERKIANILLSQKEAKRESERLTKRVKEMENDMKGIEIENSSDISNTSSQRSKYNVLTVKLQRKVEALEEELKVTRADANENISRARQLNLALAKAHDILNDKEVELRKLKLELSEKEGMLETTQKELENRNNEEEAVTKVEALMREVVITLSLPNFEHIVNNQQKVTDIISNNNNNNNTSNGIFLQRLDAISERLRLLEGSDLQLRLKNDEIIILQDEKATLMEQNKKLEQTLSNLSSMFQSIPQSPAELENLILERDLFLSTLQRCEKLKEIPNVRETCRRAELRKIENSARNIKRQTTTTTTTTPPPLVQLKLESKYIKPTTENITSEESPNSNNSALYSIRSNFRFPERSPSLIVVEEKEEIEEADSYSSPRLHHNNCANFSMQNQRIIPSPEAKKPFL